MPNFPEYTGKTGVKTENLNYVEALRFLKDGVPVRRAEWPEEVASLASLEEADGLSVKAHLAEDWRALPGSVR